VKDSIDTSAPAPPEQSPLEPGSVYSRRRKRWRSDNAKYRGQLRAVEKLEVNPKQVKVPEAML
jgi:hypothetical protein